MRRVLGTILIGCGCLLCGVPPGGCSKPDDSTTGSGPASDERAQLQPAKNLKKHNLLLVTLDTTRADYLSCYDPSKGQLSPNLDTTADDAVRFELAIAQSPATPMSHASILTGLNPYQHGARVISAAAGYKLSPKIPSLTTVLKEHGWTTAAFLSAFTVSEYYGFDHGFDTFDNGLKQDANTILVDSGDGHRRWNQKTHQRRSDATTDKTIAWLRSQQGRPFFMWVHYWDPHDRMVLPPRNVLLRFVDPQMSVDDRKRAIYRAEVYYMDSQFGRLIGTLKESGEYENTIIVIVGDHGQGLGQHDWWAHRLLYHEQLHVPLIVRVPDWPTGRVVPDLVRTVDIYPTVLAALGLEARRGIPGVSLRGLIEGTAEPPRLAYAEALNRYDWNSQVVKKRPKDDLAYCAMDRNWKLIYRYSYPEESELFSLAEDPHELNNLYKQRPEQARRLKAILDGHHSYVTAPFGSEAPDAAALQALESLGYVGTDDDEDEPNAPEGVDEPTSRPATQP